MAAGSPETGAGWLTHGTSPRTHPAGVSHRARDSRALPARRRAVGGAARPGCSGEPGALPGRCRRGEGPGRWPARAGVDALRPRLVGARWAEHAREPADATPLQGLSADEQGSGRSARATHPLHAHSPSRHQRRVRGPGRADGRPPRPAGGRARVRRAVRLEQAGAAVAARRREPPRAGDDPGHGDGPGGRRRGGDRDPRCRAQGDGDQHRRGGAIPLWPLFRKRPRDGDPSPPRSEGERAGAKHRRDRHDPPRP